jgi:hypothetical protein
MELQAYLKYLKDGYMQLDIRSPKDIITDEN